METLLGQKRLERIILINSSTFRYAEVQVDGNTHISGDNSSGKSTFLQIETLFYTGDSSTKALGIGEGKLPFVQYNLKMNNSYIVYEVRRSNKPGDCFLVFLKNSNWPTFQFFDCAYSKDIFIDENGVAYDNLESVKNAAERLHPGLDMRSARGRKDYIDILYGWRDGLVGKMRSWEKFSLTSCRGADRPHEKITNLLKMLLNLGKVQGDVLKEMIVSSMGSTAKPFDVAVQQERASQLIRQYNCIRCWTSDTNMRSRQKQYQKTYETYINEKIAYEQYPGQAKFAKNSAEENIVEITKEMEEAKAEYEAFCNSIKERRGLAEETIQNLRDKRSRIQGDYDKIADKRKQYASLMFLLPLMLSAEQRKSSLELAKKRLEDLSGQSETLTGKFDAQKKELIQKDELRSASVDTEIAKKETEATRRKGEISDKIEEERAAEEKRHTEKASLLNTQKESTAKLISEANLAVQKIKASHPKGEELKKLTERGTALDKDIRRIDGDISKLDQEIRAAETEKKNVPAAILLAHSDAIHDKDDELKEATRKQNELIQKLSTFDSSLAEWLSKNVKGWNRNLGKVLSETVLFSQDLNPRRTEESTDSAYGVQLDLSKLSPTETDPALLQERLETAKLVVEKAAKALQDEKDAAEKEIKKKIDAIDKKVGENNALLSELKTKKQSQSNILDAVRAQIDTITSEEKRIIEEAVTLKEEEIRKHEETMKRIEADLTIENDAYESFGQNLGERKRKLHKEIDDEFEAYGKELKEALTKEKEELYSTIKQIDADLAQALSEQGVDSARIKAIQDEIENLSKEVKTISDNELAYHNYLKDKADYFDHESEWADSLSSLSESIRKNEEDEKAKITEEDKTAEEKQKTVKEREEEIEELNKQVSVVKNYFFENRTEDFEKAEPIETDFTAEAIVELDKGTKGRLESQTNILNLCWSTFRNNLLEFGLQQFFPASYSCQDIGEDPRAQKDVYEFITEDLIQEHCKAWNLAAVPFVSGIAYQASDYETDIKKVRDTVSGINRLFREYNFTDVIKRIELSVEDVGSDLIALIKRSIDIHEDYCKGDGIDRNFLDGSSFNKKFISFIQDIAGNLAKNSNEQIDLKDMFTLYIEVDEGLNRSGRRRDIKDMGSNGIDTIFKNLLYLLLLTNIRKRCAEYGQGFMVHCPIDEQATLSPSNFNSLMALANRMGVYILANSPVLPNGTEESFRNAYTFWKRQGSEYTNSVKILSFNPVEEESYERES